MATPLDIAALQQFEGVFPFLFVLVVVYAILSSTEYFKDKKVLSVLISVLAAFLTLFSPLVMKTVALSMPWFVLFLLVIIFFILAFMATGVKTERIVEFIQNGEFAVGLWMLGILLAIFGGSLFYVWQQETGGPISLLNQTGEPGSIEFQEDSWNIWQTIFHPNFLGVALVLLLAAFTVKYMTSRE